LPGLAFECDVGTDSPIPPFLVLTLEGEVADPHCPPKTSGKKPQPKLLAVPQAVKHTSGIKSNFLWDKTSYVLGVSRRVRHHNSPPICSTLTWYSVLTANQATSMSDWQLTIWLIHATLRVSDHRAGRPSLAGGWGWSDLKVHWEREDTKNPACVYGPVRLSSAFAEPSNPPLNLPFYRGILPRRCRACCAPCKVARTGKRTALYQGRTLDLLPPEDVKLVQVKRPPEA